MMVIVNSVYPQGTKGVLDASKEKIVKFDVRETPSDMTLGVLAAGSSGVKLLLWDDSWVTGK